MRILTRPSREHELGRALEAIEAQADTGGASDAVEVER